MSPRAGRRTREDAVQELRSLARTVNETVETEDAPLDRIAGRVLASSVEADRDVPAHGQATMDGYAVAASDEAPRKVRDARSGPGDDPVDHRPGTATRVATGGALPRGTDAVLPVEDAETADGALVTTGIPAGQHVIARGSVVAAGETVLEAGRRLAPRDAVILRELGVERVPVRRRLSTAVLATGTEIHEGREPDRDSAFLANLLRTWGSDPTVAGSVPDDPGALGDRIAALADDHDVVVTTGGTGLGRADETGDVLQVRTDVRIEGVAIRPGSNATVAVLGDDSTVVASLPGVPGAAFASATVLLRPFFAGSASTPSSPAISATMTRDLPVPDHDVEFVVPVEFADGSPRGSTHVDGQSDAGDDDRQPVVPFGHPGSSVELFEGRFRPHRVASCVRLSAADGFVLTRTDVAAGDVVDVVPYSVVES